MSSHLQLSYVAVSSFLPCHEPWTIGNDLIMAWDWILIGFRNLGNPTWTMIDACIQKLILCRKSTSYDTTGKYTHGTTSRWQSFVVTFSCNYLLPIKIGLGRCQTIANLYLCIWPWCSHLYWCHEEGIPRWVIIPTSHHPHGLKVRGWKVSLVLLFIHNFFVSVVKDTHGH